MGLRRIAHEDASLCAVLGAKSASHLTNKRLIMLDQKQVDDFFSSGLSIVENLLPPAIIDAALAEMDALYDNDEKPTGIIGYPTGPGFEGVFQHPHLEAAACDVLHADAVELVSGATLHTLPNAEEWSYNESALHVDIQYNRDQLDARPIHMLVTFMIMLDDIPADRAPTVISPGSHQLIADYLGSEPPYQEHPTNIKDLPDLDYAEYIPVSGKKGDVAISTTGLIHGGSANASNSARKLLFAAYAPKGLDLRFNANRTDLRIDWLEKLTDVFDDDRKHIAATTLADLKK